jgi:hypothetical protein
VYTYSFAKIILASCKIAAKKPHLSLTFIISTLQPVRTISAHTSGALSSRMGRCLYSRDSTRPTDAAAASPSTAERVKEWRWGRWCEEGVGRVRGGKQSGERWSGDGEEYRGVQCRDRGLYDDVQQCVEVQCLTVPWDAQRGIRRQR